jgi:hypothetical protein
MMRLTASPALQHSLQVWVLPLLCGLQAALPASALIQSHYGSLISLPAFVLLWLFGALTFYRGEQGTPAKLQHLGADALMVAGLALAVWLVLQGDITLAVLALLSGLSLALNLTHSGTHRLTLTLLFGFIILIMALVQATEATILWTLSGYALTLTSCLMIGPQGLTHGRWSHIGLPLLAGVLGAALYGLLPRLPSTLDLSNLRAVSTPAPIDYHDPGWIEEAASGAPQHSFIINHQSLGPINLKQWQQDRGQLPAHEVFDFAGFDSQFSLPDIQPHNAAEAASVVGVLRGSQHELMLKVRTFDRFDGLRWNQSRRVFEKTHRPGQPLTLNKNAPAGATPLNYHLTLHQALPASVPVAGIPESVTLPSPIAAIDIFGQPVLPAPLQPGLSYRGVSQLAWSQQRPVSFGPEPDTEDTTLPPKFDRRITLKALQLTRGLKTARQQADALEHHLRQFAEQPTTERRSVAQFLLEDQAGTSAQAATAMVMMLRSIGIPARLITGFTVKTYNPFLGHLEISSADAHAWVDVWADEQWLAYEPGSAYQLPTQQAAPLLTRNQLEPYLNDHAVSQNLLSIINAVGWLIVVLLPLLAIGIAALFWMNKKGLTAQPEWLNTLKARWLMFQWQRHIAPVVKPNPKQKPSAIPGFEHTLTLGLSTLDQLAALSGRGRKTGELIEDWLERLDTEQSGDYQALADLVNQYWYGELPEKNLEELIELLSGILQANAVRKVS